MHPYVLGLLKDYWNSDTQGEIQASASDITAITQTVFSLTAADFKDDSSRVSGPNEFRGKFSEQLGINICMESYISL